LFVYIMECGGIRMTDTDHWETFQQHCKALYRLTNGTSLAC
jgi:hypothetical protein